MRYKLRLGSLFLVFAFVTFTWNMFFQIANTATGPSTFNQGLFVIFLLCSGMIFSYLFRNFRQPLRIISFGVLSIVPSFFLGAYRVFAHTTFNTSSIEYSAINPELYLSIALIGFYAPLIINVYRSDEDLAVDYLLISVIATVAMYFGVSTLIPML